MVEISSFGDWVRRRRKALDLTREELARQVGCASETIKKIERDERRPSRQIAELLANALAVPAEEQTLFLEVARGERPVDRLHLASQPLPPLSKQTHNLPTHLTRLIGREHEIDTIEHLLSNPDCRLLTLVGTGGIGKTRLALHIAERKVGAFRNGVWFVALAPLQSAEHIVSAIASTIGLNFSDRGDPKAQFLSYLHSKELLLVLDNFEHLMAGATLVAEILRAAPDIHVLVTSRERLNLQDEFLLKMEGLDYPTDDANMPDHFGAVQLFIERAGHIHPKLAFSQADRAAITRICRLVEGMPLAVELAAAWTHLLSCQEIADEIEQSLGILAVATRDIPERHSSMRTVFDHSWKLLSEEEQIVLRQLSVFRGGFTRESAEQVSGASLTILSLLADKSLLQVDRELYGSQRYELHELIRQYAHERLLETGEMDVLRERHHNYFLQLAEEAELKLQGAEQIDWLNRLKADHDNLRTALAWSMSNKTEAGLKLVATIWWFWRVCGYVSEGCDWIEKLLALPDAMPLTSMRAKALHGQAFLESIRYNDAKARALYEQSLALYTDLGDQLGIANALNGLGFITRRQPDWKAAARFFEKALKIGSEIGNKYVTAAALEGLGLTALRECHWQESRNFFEQFLTIERELKNMAQIATALRRLGNVDFYQGDIAVAQERYEESLSLYRELNFKQFIAILLNLLGEVARYQGDYEKALTLYSESLDLFQEQGVGFENNQLMVQINLGYVMLRQDRHAQAYELFQQNFLLGQKLEDSESCALCLIGIAGVLASQRRPQKAVSLISAARSGFDATDDILHVADQVEYEYILAKARAQLNTMEFEAAWAKGYAMSLERAIAYALEDDEDN